MQARAEMPGHTPGRGSRRKAKKVLADSLFFDLKLVYQHNLDTFVHF
jgi:hypothetical protein